MYNLDYRVWIKAGIVSGSVADPDQDPNLFAGSGSEQLVRNPDPEPKGSKYKFYDVKLDFSCFEN